MERLIFQRARTGVTYCLKESLQMAWNLCINSNVCRTASVLQKALRVLQLNKTELITVQPAFSQNFGTDWPLSDSSLVSMFMQGKESSSISKFWGNCVKNSASFWYDNKLAVPAENIQSLNTDCQASVKVTFVL